LHVATDTLNLEMIKLIYEITHISPDIKDNQNITPLHLASCHPEILQFFLSIPNINVNVQNSDGQTPLHIAVERSNDQCVTLLLNHPMIDLTLKNIDHETAYDLADSSMSCTLNETTLKIFSEKMTKIIDITSKNEDDFPSDS